MIQKQPNNPNPKQQTRSKVAQQLQKTDPEKYARLKAEAAAPYRGLRKFIYLAFAASGLLGGFIFLTQILAGRDMGDVLPNLAVQIGVVTLMVWLFRIDRSK